LGLLLAAVGFAWMAAPAFGFGDAANYYRTQSALGYLAHIRVPVLLIQSKDDTLVPFDVFETDAVRANPSIEVRATDDTGVVQTSQVTDPAPDGAHGHHRIFVTVN